MLAVFAPLPQWVNFLVMVVALLLALIGSLLWVVMSRKRRRRKPRKRHKHQKLKQPREKRKNNPTLAETGGLPPIREVELPGDPPPLP